MVTYQQLTSTNVEVNLDYTKDLAALYAGDLALKDRIRRFLPSAPNEQRDVYSKKQRLAVDLYNNYFGEIVNYYPGHLFSHPLTNRPSGAKPTFYYGFEKNCDGRGTDLVDYDRSALTEALVTSRHMTELVIPTVDATNRKEWEDLGGGNIYLRSWPGDSILDWGADESGRLNWVKLYRETVQRDSPLGEPHKLHEWIIIDGEVRDHYAIKKAMRDSLAPDETIPLVSKQVHNLGKPPIVDLWLPPGLHLGRKLRGPAVSDMRTRLARWWTLETSAYAVPVITGAEGDITVTNAVVIPDKDATFSWTTPPTDFLKAMADFEKAGIEGMHRIGARLYNANSASSYSLVRSAKARVEDKRSDHTTMKVFGAIVREHTKQILDLVSEIRQDDLTWSCEGFEHLESLQLPDLTAILESLGNVNWASISSISPTFSNELKKKALDLALIDMDQSIKDKIREEIDNTRHQETPGDSTTQQ